jgi:hypothetical protein
MTATAPAEDWEDTFTYQAVTYRVTREYHRWVVSDGQRTEAGRTLVETLDTTVRDDDLLDLIVRVLSNCWLWLPGSSPERVGTSPQGRRG